MHFVSNLQAMCIVKEILLVLLSSFALGIVIIHAQDQSGFISLDCGSPEGTSYSEATTGLNYISDQDYTQSGVSQTVSSEVLTQRQKVYVRSFPEGEKNCYNLTLGKGDRYLIRATFLYGKYDQRNERPEFDLYLGPSLWDKVKIIDPLVAVVHELVHVLQSRHLHICLVNTGKGTPFISALELRLLKNDTYTAGSMALFLRFDLCSTSRTLYRYDDDIYDRQWTPFQKTDVLLQATTTSNIDTEGDIYNPPLLAMRSACKPANASDSLKFSFKGTDPEAKYYVYMHIAEVEVLEDNQSRVFNIYNNGEYWEGPYRPDPNMNAATIYSTSPLSAGEMILKRTPTSTLPPILNAIEVYIGKEFLQLQTVDTEVDAILNIKFMYGLKRNWQGDPCTPQNLMWQGLNCTSDDNRLPRIISLNLSSSGLTGRIPPYIQNLTQLQYLDLSNNSLTGPVPEFLSELQSLTTLILKDNSLSGSVPAELVERSNNGLTLSVEGNPNLCAKASCIKKKTNNKRVEAVVASVVLIVVLVIVVAILLIIRRRKSQPAKMSRNPYPSIESKSRRFEYSEVLRITNTFERVLGKGGFGTVFYGYFNDIQVAVKMLSQSSAQGYKQFRAEVELLLRVHHRNLTPLIGYCDDGTNLGLIYEFMAKGDLAEHLSGNSSNDILTWEQRLRIALEAAQGLEYLHNGCKPPIVHRDVKCTNILLTEDLQAKLSDFGLSKSFPIEGTHVSTGVAGTPGYLDPGYCTSNRLTEKSDVYSFGVVLLEIITCRPVFDRTSKDKATHIGQWVGSMLSNGDIKNIVDPRLLGDYEINSVWKAVEMAMDCLSRASVKRPTMTYIVAELAECLSSEVVRKTRRGHESEPQDSIGMVSMDSGSETSPLAR